ncbi:MAG: glycoside hydrolase family 38 C-terminal domain-containing protein [Anaerolineae bacterium]|jgi:alpha-mannosidase
MRTLHVVSHTHWDREWYLTFQQFRLRLVRLIDRLLDLLDSNPEYRFFTLDGQTILLRDYLQIRPEQETRIHRMVQDGRLLIGPWYILPDEFLEGPEAMIRNLCFGRRDCRRFVKEPQPMERIGYLPDPFGHISQLPQIAAGFGMDALCFWRGVGQAPTEFRWASPDGTERLVLHLRESYSNGAWLASDKEGFTRDLEAERDALAPHAATSHLLILNGTDHMEPRPDLPDQLRAAEAALGDRVIHSTLPAYLSAVQDELGANGMAALPLLQGELRSPERAHLLPAVLSTRMWIKQWNARCETLLTRWAEPFCALAEQLTGDTGHRGFLHEAWDWLLQNHPHDSICGCSVDQVHREMRARFAWSEQIAQEVTQGNLEQIASCVNTQYSASDNRSLPRIIVFNPNAFPRTDRVHVRVKPTPLAEWTLLDADGQPVPCRLLDRRVLEQLNAVMNRETLAGWLAQVAAGESRIFANLYFHHLNIRVEESIAHLDITVVPEPSKASIDALNRIRVLLADPQIHNFYVRVVEDLGLDVEILARDIPSLGYQQFTVSNPSTPPRTEAQSPGLQSTHRPTYQAATFIENEFFRVEANPSDGTLNIFDKITGMTLHNVHRFVDGGDRGDEYTHCSPENDFVVDAPAEEAVIRRIDDGLGSTLQIHLMYRLPRALAEGDRSRRSSDFTDVPITSCVTLTPGVRRVKFETTVVNRAKDHRLRVHFPTPIATDHSWAESHFDVVARPSAPPTETDGWAEQPACTHPQRTFVDVTDGEHGVLLANRGLPEYQVLPGQDDAPGVTLALTLLRSTGWLSRGDLPNRDGHAGPAYPTPEAQCRSTELTGSLGKHTFRYALAPHTGNYQTAYREAHAFNAPLRAVCTDAHDGPLPASGSFVTVTPAAVVLSALKPPEEGVGLILRVYNSAPVPVKAQLKLWRPFHKASLTRMDEQSTGQPLATETDTLRLALRAKEIATVRFTMEADIHDLETDN